jgi:hypothetical protein
MEEAPVQLFPCTHIEFEEINKLLCEMMIPYILTTKKVHVRHNHRYGGNYSLALS